MFAVLLEIDSLEVDSVVVEALFAGVDCDDPWEGAVDTSVPSETFTTPTSAPIASTSSTFADQERRVPA